MGSILKRIALPKANIWNIGDVPIGNNYIALEMTNTNILKVGDGLIKKQTTDVLKQFSS